MDVEKMNIHQLLKDLDALRIKQLPLRPHSIAPLDSHVRETYATHLAALMLIESSPSEAQVQVYTQLLQALDLGDSPARYLQQAQQTDQASLREFFELVSEFHLEASFFVDGFVLCRLDAPLSDMQGQVISEFVQLMGINEKDLELYAHLAAQVLGLPSDYDLPTNFDYAAYKVEVWDEFYFRELTQDLSDRDIDNGRWIVKDKLELLFDGERKISKAKFKFKGGSILIKPLSKPSHYSFGFIDCFFESPIVRSLNVDRDFRFKLEGCQFTGHYSMDDRVTSVFVSAGKVEFSKCKVDIKNARFFKSSSADFEVSFCQFSGVGHPELSGGVLVSLEDNTMTIVDSIFEACVAKHGGGFAGRCNSISKIVGSKFLNCFSLPFDMAKKATDPEGFSGSGGAVYSLSPELSDNVRGNELKNTGFAVSAMGYGHQAPRDNIFGNSYMAFFGSNGAQLMHAKENNEIEESHCISLASNKLIDVLAGEES